MINLEYWPGQDSIIIRIIAARISIKIRETLPSYIYPYSSWLRHLYSRFLSYPLRGLPEVEKGIIEEEMHGLVLQYRCSSPLR
jgi:hypothetical protein